MIKVIELGGPLTSDGLPKMAAAAKWVILCISVGSLGCFPGSPERGTGTTEPGSRGLSERNPNDWDAYLRRAEANHALNQREAAALDYTKAIALHPSEAFLYLRRGRHYNARRLCDAALRDFDSAIPMISTSFRQGYDLTAELYSLQSGVYAGCILAAERECRRLCERSSDTEASPRLRDSLCVSSGWPTPT
jgi:tetratricopeptide (TPR) repeat protein